MTHLTQCFEERAGSSLDITAHMRIRNQSRPLVNFCYKLFRNRDPKEKVVCAECDLKLNLCAKGRVLRTQGAISHACIHIGRQLFSCRHCDKKTVTEPSMQKHIKRIHKLVVSKKNYTDLSSNYREEIIAQLTQCFGTQTDSEPASQLTLYAKKALEKQQPKLGKLRLFVFCRDLFEKQRQKGKTTVHCSQCSTCLKIKSKDRLQVTRKAIDHAANHLGKALYLCRQCECQFTTKAAMYAHLRKIHALSCVPANFVDLFYDHQQEIKDTLTRCFENQKGLENDCESTKPKPIPVRQRNCSISNFCRRLFAGRDRDAPVCCSICRGQLQVYGRGCINAQVAIAHACSHLGKILFTCRYCDHGTVNESAMRCHLLNTHKLKTSKENFNNISLNYREEIVAILTKCFGQKNHQGVDNSTPNNVTSNGEDRMSITVANRVKSRTRGNELLAERQLHCYRLVQKHVDKLGKIQCRICSIKIATTFGGRNFRSSGATNHAMSHFDKLLFSCQRCSKATKTVHCMRRHISVSHGVSSKGNYVDRSNDYHSDIMNILFECYDWS